MAAAVRNARLHEQAQSEAAARARAEATAAEREHAARVLAAVGEGVFLVDDEGIVRFWNRAAELVTGRSGEEARRAPGLGDLRELGRRRGRDPDLRGSGGADAR